MIATVMFDTEIRESFTDPPGPVREIWRFIRPVHSENPIGFVDGIRQLED